MLHLKNISLKYKIPLRITVLVSVTAFILASTLVYRGIKDLRSNLIANADRMGRVIADTVVEPMKHDDVWRSLEIINAPFRIPEYHAPDQGAEYILILNAANKVFVATQPKRFPMLSDPAAIEPRYTEILKTLPGLRKPVPTVIEPDKSANLFLLIPIQSDGVRLGTLVMSYPKSPFASSFYSLTQGAILTTLLVIIILLPLGMYWGRKMAAPLLQLSDAMRNITPNLPETGEIMLEESNDEIGQLGKAFKVMLAELREKEQLQQQVISSNRLAAIGRLTAGIAHEINNPLGGMLNAISTYKRHGSQDALTLKTLSILERGLIQIKETVAALLVEAKSRTRPFDRNDVEDIRTLIQPDIKEKNINFTGEIDITGIQTLPSTLVRQVIINLLLNAVQATQEHGQVCLNVHSDDDSLIIDVTNSGSFIPKEKVPYLFEPFASMKETGSGLGLWVIYQIVQQLGGHVSVQSVPDETRFTVQLPIQKERRS